MSDCPFSDYGHLKCPCGCGRRWFPKARIEELERRLRCAEHEAVQGHYAISRCASECVPPEVHQELARERDEVLADLTAAETRILELTKFVSFVATYDDPTEAVLDWRAETAELVEAARGVLQQISQDSVAFSEDDE